ncbi:MAG: hypothetical protein L3J14_03300 [Flavobacteriaceae bacterium]|nr:hypothetical protein [Flavobacteriaceae bacterium]
MKNIKFIPLFLIAFSLIISSCAIDDDDPVIPTGTVITASLDRTGEIFVFAGNEITLDFVLSRALTSSTIISYILDGVENTITIGPGLTSKSISIPNVTGKITNVVLTEASALNDDIVSPGSTNTEVTFIGVPAVNPSSLQVLMLWGNDQNDLDLFVTNDPAPANPAADNIVNSQSFTPGENVSFNNSNPDGTYNVIVREWSSVVPSDDVTMYIVHPNGSVDAFNNSVELEQTNANYRFFVKFDKVGSVYTVTQVPTTSIN